MKIKKIKPADFPKIFDLWKKAGLKIESKEEEKKDFINVLEKNPNSCLAIYDCQKVLGSVLGSFNGRRAWIYHLAIHPEYQKSGYGSKLLKELENSFLKEKAPKMSLFVAKNNSKVVTFYEKNGFEIDSDVIYLTKKI